jgi:hypothetical protein
MSPPVPRLPPPTSRWSAHRKARQHPRHRRSRRAPLVQGFRAALRSPGLFGPVIVTDVNPLSPAVHVADRACRVPMSSDPAYLDEIQEITGRHIRASSVRDRSP